MYTRVFNSFTIVVAAGPSKDFAFFSVAEFESVQLLVDIIHARLEHVHRVERRIIVVVIIRAVALAFGFRGSVQLHFYLLSFLLKSVQLLLGLVLRIVGLALPLFLSGSTFSLASLEFLQDRAFGSGVSVAFVVVAPLLAVSLFLVRVLIESRLGRF